MAMNINKEANVCNLDYHNITMSPRVLAKIKDAGFKAVKDILSMGLYDFETCGFSPLHSSYYAEQIRNARK